MSDPKRLNAFAWVARIWSVLSIGFVLLFVFGELFGGEGSLPSKSEWIGLTFWPIGVIAGLAIAWFRKGLGGMVAVLSLIAFYIWSFVERGRLPGGPYFLLVAAPGVLFLLSSLLSRRRREMRPA